MRKLSFTFLLIAISFMALGANTSLSHKRGKVIDFGKWDKPQRNPVSNPIDATVEDNYIKVQFFKSQDRPVTFQIKDRYGDIVFQDVVLPNEQETYNINLDGFIADQYELHYLGENMTLVGTFQVE